MKKVHFNIELYESFLLNEIGIYHKILDFKNNKKHCLLIRNKNFRAERRCDDLS